MVCVCHRPRARSNVTAGCPVPSTCSSLLSDVIDCAKRRPTNFEIVVADALELAQRVLGKLTVTGSKNTCDVPYTGGINEKSPLLFHSDRCTCCRGPRSLRGAPQAGRRQQAYRLKVDAAVYQRDHAWANNLTNGDEQAYPNHIASFTKTLPHNQLGEVDSKAYAQLTRALDSGLEDDFAAIPLGGTVKLQDPQAAFCFDLFGADSHQLALPPPPAFASAEIAGEITELYWQALTRDVPFAEYGTNSLVGQALDDLNRLSDFRGPKVNSRVTAGTLFRGLTPGDMKGPYVSQLLAKPIPFGAAQVVQQYRVPQSGLDYMTAFNEWLSVENGIPTGKVFTGVYPEF
jgi:hypothetical protein